MNLKVLAMVSLAPLLMAQNGGCDGDTIPTTEQIEFYIPANFRNCPYAPNSPGSGASKAERAVYIQGLYYAWKRCYDDNAAIDKLYAQYRQKLKEAAYGTEN